MAPPRVFPLGDSAITIELGTERSRKLLREVHAAAAQIRSQQLQHVTDVVPAYLAVTVFYDAIKVSYSEIAEQIVGALDASRNTPAGEETRHHVIPVEYSGADLQSVADTTGLRVAEVVARHSAKTYTVDLLGFVPGWAYMSELDPSLQIPRRQQPRPRVPAGSVAIAATQTGIYPLDTPGGWHILGRTAATMFDPTRDPPALLKAGDTVKFEPFK
ncbi:MAG TPA: 5-oxoprolinase subunit PxpB [Gemmatimonadaceae bacterium]|nr:5-oxoprolinase subunit PxpB [Gemmatimonadaceae bacterium]